MTSRSSRSSSRSSSSRSSSSNSSSENIAWDEQICELQDEIAMLRNLLNEVTKKDWNNTLDKIQEIRGGMIKGKICSDWYDFLADYSGYFCTKTIQNVILQEYNCFRNIHHIDVYSGTSRISTFKDILTEMKFILEHVGEISGKCNDICSILCKIWQDKGNQPN